MMSKPEPDASASGQGLRTVLAGDLGGTKCRFALVSEDYGVHCVQRIDTVREREPFLERMTAAIAAVLEQRQATEGGAMPLQPPVACGLGTAGVIPPSGGTIAYAPNLPLGGFPLADYLRDQFGLPTTLLNDGRASAWGEYLRGHAKQQDPLLCLFFGTGVGIGLIADGKPFAGGTNAAGEIGHTVFRPGGRRCPCGRIGHYEAYCGGRAITERAAQEIGDADDGHWTVGDVVATAAGAGDRAVAARAILDDAFLAISVLVQNACIMLNPSAVVLGGGVTAGWPELSERIAAHVRANTAPAIHEKLEFVPSLGGSDAILWGAAAVTGSLWTSG